VPEGIDLDRWQRIPEPIRAAWYGRGLSLPMTTKQMAVMESLLQDASPEQLAQEVKRTSKQSTTYSILASAIALVRSLRDKAKAALRLHEEQKAWGMHPSLMQAIGFTTGSLGFGRRAQLNP